ncbi:MAG: hypothetical protein IK052_03485 [Bacteroidales bacterium]|nr:hypothetical protein [Bacteroidales bacterium]
MEYHIHIVCDGDSVHIDGLPGGPDSLKLPDSIVRGVTMIWDLVESRVREADCICIGGIGYTGDTLTIAAFDIWVQAGEEGYFLPMDISAKLFSENGIPYFHSPFMS